MSNLLTSIEHKLAVAASDVVKASKFIETSILPILKTAAANEAVVESVTALIDPQAVNVERIAYAVLGLVIKAVEDTDSAVAANGINVTLDAQLISDIKAIVPAVQSKLPVAK